MKEYIDICIPYVTQQQYNQQCFGPIWTFVRYKTWTLDSGLDYGLDYELDYELD